MATRRWLLLIPMLVAVLAGSARAAGRVELELVTEPDFPPLEVQSWYRLFSGLKVRGLRIRTARATDKVQLVSTGPKSAPVYRITGVLTARNQLLVPGAKFTLRDGAKIADWIKRIEAYGPSGRKKVTAFGLAPEQFEAVRKDFAQRIAFTTQGKARAEVLEKLAAGLSHGIALQRGAREALKEAGDLAEDLHGMSYGTAMAYLLRPAGLGVAPRVAGGKVRFEVRSGLTEKQAWPVGVSAQDRRRKLAPALFKFLNVEVPKGTLLVHALEDISAKIKAPILLHHNALAELDLELTKAKITVPPRRTTPSLLIGQILRAAHPRLLAEFRVDEADKPFIWVTIFRVK